METLREGFEGGFAFAHAGVFLLRLEVVGSVGAAEVLFFRGDPVVFAFHLGEGLGAGLLFFLAFFDLVCEFLFLQAFFGDSGGFGPGSLFEGSELFVESGECGAFVVKSGLGYVVSILSTPKNI